MPENDITKPVDLTTHSEGTGALRSRRPVYMDFMPPCNSACPAGENIQGWMAFAQAGNYFEAFQTMMEDNPFPGIMGRICVKPCETGCNRNHIDDTVNIHAVERFIGDEAIKNNWQLRTKVQPTGKRVLVVGAGPSGLSAAYHLAKAGHEVEIHEASGHIGGLMWSGIPEYRLPKEILDTEINRIAQMGVTIRLNSKVDDLMGLKHDGKFDAVYLGIGAQKIQEEIFDHDNSVYIKTAFEFFAEIKINPSAYLHKKVVVYGGGKLAMYLSRIIKRYGSEALVYFPGDKKMMPAYDYETEDALAEGVDVQLYKKIQKIENNKISFETLKVEKNKAIGTAEFETIDADILIIANRQAADTAFLKPIDGIQLNEDGTIIIDGQRMTGHTGIFAGGDTLTGENRSSTIAIGHGKKAAKTICSFLENQSYSKGEKHPTAGYRKLHMWYKTEPPQNQ